MVTYRSIMSERKGSEYARLPKDRRKGGDRGTLSSLTNPREFFRAWLETIRDLASDPFVIAGSAAGIIAGGVALSLGVAWPWAVALLVVTAIAVVCTQVFF